MLLQQMKPATGTSEAYSVQYVSVHHIYNNKLLTYFIFEMSCS